MHAESHLEVAENKGKERREGSVDFVKFMETGNTVDFLDVQCSLLMTTARTPCSIEDSIIEYHRFLTVGHE